MDPVAIRSFNLQYIEQGGEWNIDTCLTDNKIETYSGPGSLLKNTENLIIELNNFIKDKHIKSIIDVPCGDFNYMKHIDLNGINYKGFDVSINAVEMCKKYSKENTNFSSPLM